MREDRRRATCRFRHGAGGQRTARHRGRPHLGGGGAAGAAAGGSARRSRGGERGDQRVHRRRRLVLPDRRGRGTYHRHPRLPLPGPPGRLAAAAGLVLGAVAAALLALWIGENIGLGTYNHLLATSPTGALLPRVARLGAKSALAFWPLLTSAVIMLAETAAPAASAAAADPATRRVRHVDKRSGGRALSVDWAGDFPYRPARARTGQPQPDRLAGVLPRAATDVEAASPRSAPSATTSGAAAPQAVREYTARFDGVDLETTPVPRKRPRRGARRARPPRSEPP
jgi:hypothetical protein